MIANIISMYDVTCHSQCVNFYQVHWVQMDISFFDPNTACSSSALASKRVFGFRLDRTSVSLEGNAVLEWFFEMDEAEKLESATCRAWITLQYLYIKWTHIFLLYSEIQSPRIDRFFLWHYSSATLHPRVAEPQEHSKASGLSCYTYKYLWVHNIWLCICTVYTIPMISAFP